MALRIRLKPGKDNDRLTANLDPQKIELAKIKSIQLFGLVLKRKLVEVTFRLTKSRTGTLARSWKVIPKRSSLQISNRARGLSSGGVKGKPYGAYLEFGTKAHFVGPRKGRAGLHGKPPALAFPRGGGGPPSSFKGKFNAKNFFFSKGHRVRGIKARRFVPRAIARVGKAFSRILDTEIKKALG